MIYHTVWFKLTNPGNTADREQIERGLRGMIPEIPEIVEMHTGGDFSGRSRGFELGLVVTFQTREDGQIYDKHPKHQEFIASHKHLWSEVMALDFENKAEG